MGRSNRFADMNEVYVHIETIHKEQPAIRLWPKGCRRQPRPRFTEVEGKSNAEPWQYKEDQFQTMRDQIEDLTTQLSNLCRHNEDGSRNLFTEHRTQGRQHFALAHTNQRVSRFKLDTPKFQSCLQPKEFMVAEKNRKFPQKEVPRKMAKMVSKEGAEIKHQSVSRYIRGTCQQFQRTCILGGKVAKLVINPMSGMNVVSEEAVRKLGLKTKRHLTPYQLEWLTKGNEVRVSKYCQVPFSIGTKYVDHVWCDVVDMTTCQLLLGKPWQNDKTAIYDETKDTYSFMLGKTKLMLLHSLWAELKPSQRDSQSFVAKQELTDKESDIKGVVPGPIKKLLEKFVDVVQAKLPKEAQPLQDIQPPRGVVPGSKLPNHPLHIKSPKEHEELGKQVEEVNLSKSIAIFHEEEVSLSESFAIFHEEEEPLEEVNLSDSFAIFYDNFTYHVLDKSPEDKAFDLSDTPINYVDFIGVDAILSNSSNQICDEIYMAEGNVLSKSDGVVASYLKIFMAYGKDKAQEKHGKSTRQCEVRGLQYYHHSLEMIRAIMFLMGCCLVILRRGEWNELTRHLKDRGKDKPNSRMNSLQQGENDADCVTVNLFYFLNRLYVVILLALGFWESLFRYFIRFRVMGVFTSYFIRFRFWTVKICL
jgi:hypothetical protein